MHPAYCKVRLFALTSVKAGQLRAERPAVVSAEYRMTGKQCLDRTAVELLDAVPLHLE